MGHEEWEKCSKEVQMITRNEAILTLHGLQRPSSLFQRMPAFFGSFQHM